MSVTVVFSVPGKLNQLTGGYIFDRRVVESFKERGSVVHIAELPGTFPQVNAEAIDAATELVDSLRQEQVLVIDGLALPAFASLLPLQGGIRAIGFIHHPLFLETGLSKELVSYFYKLESTLWPLLDGLICASPSTARTVIQSGVSSYKVQVVSPGVDIPVSPLTQKITSTLSPHELRLLCVATISARKGHIYLVQALAQLRHHAWTLDCYGSLERDPDTVRKLTAVIAQHDLTDRIKLHGEISPQQLSNAWEQADIFILPSLHEGYGMVLTEAIAYGLPVVSTLAGAIPETVPKSASILVEPSNAQALASALDELMLDGAKLESLKKAAIHERSSLVTWPKAIESWHQALNKCLRYEKLD